MSKPKKDKTRLTLKLAVKQESSTTYTVHFKATRTNHKRELPVGVLDRISSIMGEAILETGLIDGIPKGEITVSLNFYHEANETAYD